MTLASGSLQAPQRSTFTVQTKPLYTFLFLCQSFFLLLDSCTFQVTFLSKESYSSGCCSFTVEWFPWMNLNAPGFSERLIVTMGNNYQKFTLWVPLKPDVMSHPARGKAFMKPGITVSEDTLGAVATFICVAAALCPDKWTLARNHRIAEAVSSTNVWEIYYHEDKSITGHSPNYFSHASRGADSEVADVSLQAQEDVKMRFLILKSSPMLACRVSHLRINRSDGLNMSGEHRSTTRETSIVPQFYTVYTNCIQYTHYYNL